MLSGFLLILAAAVLQGSFVVPMTRTRGWRWEHTWLAFSVLGMLVFNWMFGLAAIPRLTEVLAGTPLRDLAVLSAFGALSAALKIKSVISKPFPCGFGLKFSTG